MARSRYEFTQHSIPDHFRDTNLWPCIELSEYPLKARLRIERLKRAVRAYVEGQSLAAVGRECKVSRGELLRTLNRALLSHEDGRLFGWRALVPYKRIKPYERLSRPGSSPRGLAGAFEQFLCAHPSIRESLNTAILTMKIPGSLPESRLSNYSFHSYFKRLCREDRVSETQYPLSTKDAGARSIARYALKLRNAHFATAARQAGGPDAALRARTGTGAKPHLKAEFPFDFVSIDSHKLNFVGCISLTTTQGVIEPFPINRMHILPVFDHYSSAVLGYKLSISQEPSANDVVEAVRSALQPWKALESTLPGFQYPPNAAMPSGAMPEAIGQCWNALLLDNATINCSHAVAERLGERLGCATNWGPVRQWYRRPHIEALFSSIERSGFLRLPNSTGTGPQDPRRPDGATKAVEYDLRWDQMLYLVDVLLSTYNARRRADLGNRSPLERLNDALLGARTFWLPRTLPELPSSLPDLDVKIITKTIRGSVEKGRRPYVQYARVHYTNHLLSSAVDLIGTKIRLHVRETDLARISAFFLSGEELGILEAGSGFSSSRQDAKLRRDMFKEVDKGNLHVAPDTNIVHDFLRLKAAQILDEKRARKKSKRNRISKQATTLARTLNVTQRSAPIVDASATASRMSEPPLAQPSRSTPSFVPKVRHRGLIK